MLHAMKHSGCISKNIVNVVFVWKVSDIDLSCKKYSKIKLKTNYGN
jgi:hypothetical protein